MSLMKVWRSMFNNRTIDRFEIEFNLKEIIGIYQIMKINEEKIDMVLKKKMICFEKIIYDNLTINDISNLKDYYHSL